MNPWEQEVTPHEDYGLVDDFNDIYKAAMNAASDVVKHTKIINKHLFMRCLAQDLAQSLHTLLEDETTQDAIEEYKQDRDLFPESIPAIEEFQ